MRKSFLAPFVQVEFVYKIISPVPLWSLYLFYTQSCQLFSNSDTWKSSCMNGMNIPQLSVLEISDSAQAWAS